MFREFFGLFPSPGVHAWAREKTEARTNGGAIARPSKTRASQLSNARLGMVLCVLGSILLVSCSRSFAFDDPARPEGPLTKALKRVPADRQGPIIDMIGKRGGPADLDYLFEQALIPDAFKPSFRLKALEALAEASQTREMLPPPKPSRLATLIENEADPALRVAAVKLVGLWKVRGLTDKLKTLAGTAKIDDSLRAACLDSLASVGGNEARDAILSLTTPERPATVRSLAIGALARLDVDEAASRAGSFLRDPGNLRDLTPLVAAFVNRQGGADKLAEAIERAPIPSDPARLVLRAVFALGRSDPALVTNLTRAAGLDAAVQPLDRTAMERMIAEVASKGNAERGEMIFRRADLGCMKCHALSGAGGGVGPDLSALGSSSPVNYVVNSIMLPDQAIKEEFQTRVVLTIEGQIYQGIVADKDDKRIILKEATGALRTIATADIEASKEGGSLMPKGLVNFLTRSEFVDLVRFLSELGKPGPYAIRSTPTIQRWRFLKSVPTSHHDSVPDPEMLQTEVLNAAPSQWLPAYAKLGGDLPLDELTAEAGTKILYLQAEVDVSHGDKVKLVLNSPDGVTAWIDREPAPPFVGNSFATEISTGRHIITLRINTSHRKPSKIRAELLKPEGSSAEYSVVGGR